MHPMRQLLFSSLLVMGCGSTAIAATAYKCTDPDGKLSFQQLPCAGDKTAQVISLEPEIDPERQAENEALLAANHGSDKPDQSSDYVAALAAANAPTRNQSPRQAPVCPPTRENPGRTPPPSRISNPKGYGYPDLVDDSAARAYVARLPSRTYLKNGGRWPKGCPG